MTLLVLASRFAADSGTVAAIVTPSQRTLDVLQFASKVTIAFAAFWTAVSKIVKPLYTWWQTASAHRRRQMAIDVREALRPELEKLEIVAACNDRLDVVIKRQAALFTDIDDFLVIASTNAERLDETNALLDAIGFSSDRRTDDEKRARIDKMLSSLRTRQTDRRRAVDAEREIDERAERLAAGADPAAAARDANGIAPMRRASERRAARDPDQEQ